METPDKKRPRIETPSPFSKDMNNLRTQSKNGGYNLKDKKWMDWNANDVRYSKRFWAPCPSYSDNKKKKLQDFFKHYEGGIYIKSYGDWQLRNESPTVETVSNVGFEYSNLITPTFTANLGDFDDPFESTFEPTRSVTTTCSTHLNRVLELSSIYMRHFLRCFSGDQGRWLCTPILFHLVDNHVKNLMKKSEREYLIIKQQFFEGKKLNSIKSTIDAIWEFYKSKLKIKSGYFHEDEDTNVKFYLATFFCVMRVNMYKVGMVSYNFKEGSNSAIVRRLNQYAIANETIIHAFRFPLSFENKRVFMQSETGYLRTAVRAAMESVESSYHRAFAKLGYMTSVMLNQEQLTKIFTQKYDPAVWVGPDGSKVRKYFEYVYGIDGPNFLNQIIKNCSKWSKRLCQGTDLTVTFKFNGNDEEILLKIDKLEDNFLSLRDSDNWNSLKDVKIVNELKNIFHITPSSARNLSQNFNINMSNLNLRWN